MIKCHAELGMIVHELLKPWKILTWEGGQIRIDNPENIVN